MRLAAAIYAILMLIIPAFGADWTPGSIRAMLATQDAAAVVQAMAKGDLENNPWSHLLDRLEAGDPDWLALVPLLAPGTDAGTAEDLVITLSRTLKTNASGVLGLLAAGQFSVGAICIDNDIEVPLEDYVAFLDAISVTVAAVLDPAVREVRNQCLYQIATERLAALVGSS